MEHFKSIWNKIKNDWRNQIIFYSLAFILFSLFLPRAFLSISLITFILVSFLHNNINSQLQRFISSVFLIGISLLFFVPLITGLWSDAKHIWINMMRIKLPLFMLPLAFAAPMNLSKKQWERLILILISLVTISTCWSFALYLQNIQIAHEGYLKAKTIPTALNDDHVRFSWLISVTILLTAWLLISKWKTSSKIFLAAISVILFWLIIYLHILAARTGLFCLYTIFFIVAIWILVRKSNLWISGLIFICIIVLPVSSYFLFPTFQNRIKYFLYDASYFRQSTYLPGSNDGMRIFSMKAGIDIIKHHPLSGVGFGDIRAETNQWYEANIPGILEDDKLLPSSEWLIFGAGSGWPGILIFTVVILIPYFIVSLRGKLIWLLLNIASAIALIFDIGLEVQYGVVLFTLIILCCWKYIKSERKKG